MKTAFCRISDTEPLLSIAKMFEAIGFHCVLPDRDLRNHLRNKGCRNVDEFEDMHRRWGAEMPTPQVANLPSSFFQEVGRNILNTCDLYVDINGCYNGPKLWEEYPRLKERTLTYFINGGEPRNTWDKGDCQSPLCPMMTTAQHYRSTLFCPVKHPNAEAFSCDDPPNPRGYWTNTSLSHPKRLVDPANRACGILEDDATSSRYGFPIWLCPWGCGPLKPAPWLGKVYTFWPAFTRQAQVRPRSKNRGYSPPVSFVHNCLSWGCQAFVEPARKMGAKAYGGGSSPDGLVRHEDCFDILQSALCTVYLKGGGAVDYSILEPMACSCPTTFHESYVHNTRLYDLLIDEETCLMWNSEETMAACFRRLRDPQENRRIGENGRKRMYELQWSTLYIQEVERFKTFIERNFPCVK